jgi:hypothetical protein
MVVHRRAVINGTLLSGLAALAPAEQSRSGSSQAGADEAAVAKAIEELNTTVRHAIDTSPELARIRNQRRIFLKANHGRVGD